MRKLSVFILVILAACSSPKKEITTQVTKLETELQTKFDHKKAGELIASYDLYIQKYPQDSTSRIYMAKATEMSILDNQPQEALRFINLFLKTYPADPKAGLMQFKKAMVYDLLLHDGLRAVAEYNIFIQNFPLDPMRVEAENAILLIQNPEAFMATYGEQGDTLTQGNSK
jgi:outer membrane protein assembly factor BamD (BamD/ComL family)